MPPLGYRVQDRKLVIVDGEAEIVRSIFRRYAELGSVRLLKEGLEAQGTKSKSWTSAAGRVIGGKPFSFALGGPFPLQPSTCKKTPLFNCIGGNFGRVVYGRRAKSTKISHKRNTR